jgi:hypothetical protein
VSDGEELLGLLAEPVRLRVAAALVLGTRTPADIARAADVDTREALQALARLEAGGLAERDGDGWRFVADRLTAAARAAAPPPPGPDDHGASDPAAAKVLGRYLRGGRLLSVPSARGKRLVILDHLARVFEPGVRYPEREVNAYLRAFHDDVAALRRYLVDEGLLSREAGVYWRSGGPVDV